MQPSGAVENVRPEIGLYFGDRPPVRTPSILRLGSQGIDIPPGEGRYVIRDSYTVPVDVDVLAIQPHAHYRAKEIIGTATWSDGRSQRVMHIKDWDFRWQHVYRLVQPLPLPKGTTLSMEYTYDNSATNVRNPEVPPLRVLWGQRSKDEMGDLWFQLLPRTEPDRRRMNAEITQKMIAEDIIGYETMLRVDPRDHELHDDVAMLYLGLGKPGDAVKHFRASLDVRGDSPAAHYNLGTALSVAGQFDEAVIEYRASDCARPTLRRGLLEPGQRSPAAGPLARRGEAPGAGGDAEPAERRGAQQPVGCLRGGGRRREGARHD